MPYERLFSTAGDVIRKHRSCLLPENAELSEVLRLFSFTAVTVHLQYTTVKLTHFTVEF